MPPHETQMEPAPFVQQPTQDTLETDIEASHKTSQCLRLRLEWKNIGLVKQIKEGHMFNHKRTPKTILKGINGSAEPGEVLAIMGPSGGGKTSLLNCLSKRNKVTEGKVTLNGRKLPKNFNKISAYVMQEDRLFEVLTPRELFQFSANLRLPKHTSKAERKEKVEAVISKLKLGSCADTRVGGNLMKGLSGGEKKRTAIGYELIPNPSLLFLDEPTSGLDSFNAFSLIESLKKLADEGHTIICTIHQPSSEIFQKFDRLNLLVRGEVAYFGTPQDSIEFFSKLGHPCPTYSNPSDFFMNILQTQDEADLKRTQKFVEAAREANLTEKSDDDKAEVDRDLIPPKRASYFVQLRELTKRSWITLVRNPLSFRARVIQYIVIALLVGCVYYKLSYNQVGISDRVGALFFVTVGMIMSALNSVLLTFPLERHLLIREQTNGMYSVSSYYFGKFISGFPLDVMFPTFFTLIIYWMVGFNPAADRFFMFLLVTVLLNFTSSSFGLLLGCMLPNAEVAASLAPVLIVPFMLFAGFYIDINSIPVWLRWIQYISMFKWGLQALISNEFAGETFTCTPDELVSAVGNDGQEIQVCPITNGDKVVSNFGYEFPRDYWVAVGVLIGLFVAFRALALGFLVWQTKRSLKKDQ